MEKDAVFYPLIYLLIMENAAKDLSVPFLEAVSQDRLAVVSMVDILLLVTSYFDIVWYYNFPNHSTS